VCEYPADGSFLAVIAQGLEEPIDRSVVEKLELKHEDVAESYL
jgi:hypothetical protein